MKSAKKSTAARKSPEYEVSTPHLLSREQNEDSMIGISEKTRNEELDFERQQRIAERAKKASTARINDRALSALSSPRKGAPLSDEVKNFHNEEKTRMVAEELEDARNAVANVPKVRHTNGGIRLTDELFEAICVAIGKGDSVHRLCERPDMPGREAFFDRCERDATSAKRYSRALALRGERFADQIAEIADESYYAQTPEQAASYRLRVETRKWLAARLLPKKYGERVTLEGNADNPLVTQLVLGGDALAKRIRGGDK